MNHVLHFYVFKRFHNLQREKYKSECVLLFDTYDGESFSLTSFYGWVYCKFPFYTKIWECLYSFSRYNLTPTNVETQMFVSNGL